MNFDLNTNNSNTSNNNSNSCNNNSNSKKRPRSQYEKKIELHQQIVKKHAIEATRLQQLSTKYEAKLSKDSDYETIRKRFAPDTRLSNSYGATPLTILMFYVFVTYEVSSEKTEEENHQNNNNNNVQDLVQALMYDPQYWENLLIASPNWRDVMGAWLKKNIHWLSDELQKGLYHRKNTNAKSYLLDHVDSTISDAISLAFNRQVLIKQRNQEASTQISSDCPSAQHIITILHDFISNINPIMYAFTVCHLPFVSSTVFVTQLKYAGEDPNNSNAASSSCTVPIVATILNIYYFQIDNINLDFIFDATQPIQAVRRDSTVEKVIVRGAITAQGIVFEVPENILLISNSDAVLPAAVDLRLIWCHLLTQFESNVFHEQCIYQLIHGRIQFIRSMKQKLESDVKFLHFSSYDIDDLIDATTIPVNAFKRVGVYEKHKILSVGTNHVGIHFQNWLKKLYPHCGAFHRLQLSKTIQQILVDYPDDLVNVIVNYSAFDL